MKNISDKILLLLFMFFVAASVNAQDAEQAEKPEKTEINGVISDNYGKPIVGALISSIDGKSKAISDAEGKYIIDLEVNYTDEILFSLTGYQSKLIKPESNSEINVQLQQTENFNADDVVYLGLSSQKRGKISGAVSTVTGAELEKSPVPNLSQSLTGRLPGLYTYEAYSEPSRARTNMSVRGANSIWANSPLVVIDGIPYNYNTQELFEYISASEVESVTMLKDASTQSIYGIQGADGVLVVTTKRGVQGKLKVDVKLDQTFEQVSTKLPFLNSADYVQLRNQAGYNDGLGEYAYYSKKDVEGFVLGENRELYPNNDWRKINMKDLTNMQRINVNLNGGNGKTTFFTNVNVMHQDGMWKTDQTKYNPNNNFLWANFRSNVDVKFNSLLSASMNLSGNIKREKTPGSHLVGGFADGVYYRLYSVPSNVYGPTTPRQIDPDTGDVINPGGGVVVTGTEPYPAYAIINRMGYANHTVTNIYAQFALKLDMSFLTKGLNLNGFVGYQTNSTNSQYTYQGFASWTRNSGFDNLGFSPYGTNTDTPLAHYKGTGFYYNIYYKGTLDYARSFGKHNVSAMAFAYYQVLNTSSVSSPELLPYKRVNSGVEAAYDYDNRYLLKLNLSYSGSEQYARSHRFTALPSVSAGWVVSNESFMESADWVDLLKLRASYGKTGNDRSQLGRYTYLDNISLINGGPLPYLNYLVKEGQAANPNLKPEVSVKQNYGIDLSLFKSLSVSFDVFHEKMSNMVSGGVSVTPSYQGIPLKNFPRINSGVFENKGYEIAVDYTKAINRDFAFNVGGWLAHTKNKVISNDESQLAEDYAYRKRTEGYSLGQAFGYLVDNSNGNGFFNSQQEITESNLVYEIGNPRPGDLKYYDLNNDGIINDKDKAPIGFGSSPLYTYAFHAKASYKSFDLSVLFQGVAEYYTVDLQTGRTEFAFEGVYADWHKNAWTAERYANGQKISYPALSTKSNSNHQGNSFFLQDKSYMRLKNLEIGYTLPKRLTSSIGSNNIRFYLSGQNLLTWHKLQSKEFGPEGDYMSIPVYRLYNIGLTVKF